MYSVCLLFAYCSSISPIKYIIEQALRRGATLSTSNVVKKDALKMFLHRNVSCQNDTITIPISTQSGF